MDRARLGSVVIAAFHERDFFSSFYGGAGENVGVD
jgi:hypothetical protein